MGPSPTYHPPQGEECASSVEHRLPLWAEPAVGYCLRRPRPSPMWGSRFVGARDVGPWVSEQKRLGKTPLGNNASPEMTYLPISNLPNNHTPSSVSCIVYPTLCVYVCKWREQFSYTCKCMNKTTHSILTFPTTTGNLPLTID